MSEPKFKYEPRNSKLIIEVDCSEAAFKAATASASGKSRTLCTTRGNTNVIVGDKTVKLGLNVYFPNEG